MDYYVMLVGSINNAGDFLIRQRAIELLQEIRKDREIVIVDRREFFDKKKLELVNNSKALLLTGGPAIRPSMYPGIFPLTSKLDDINVPIVCYGLGWASAAGDWIGSHNVIFTSETKQLINKINSSGIFSGVRDYHAKNVLQYAGVKNVSMTGCPALYDVNCLGRQIVNIGELKNITFSPGTSFMKSKEVDKSMKILIKSLKEYFATANFVVAFHHSLEDNILKKAYKSTGRLAGQRYLVKWLEQNDIDYVDISGSSEKMVDHYSKCDLHVGYRVHAHILMNSIRKLSVLLAEDGRSVGLRSVLGGLIFDHVSVRIHQGILKRKASYTIVPNIAEDIIVAIQHEKEFGFPRSKTSFFAIDSHYYVMKKFLEQLP